MTEPGPAVGRAACPVTGYADAFLFMLEGDTGNRAFHCRPQGLDALRRPTSHTFVSTSNEMKTQRTPRCRKCAALRGAVSHSAAQLCSERVHTHLHTLTAVLPVPPQRTSWPCLLVFDEPPALDELGHLVGGMAHEQEPVARLHLVGESHERQGVTAEGCERQAEGSRDSQLRDLVWGGPQAHAHPPEPTRVLALRHGTQVNSGGNAPGMGSSSDLDCPVLLLIT